MPRRYPDEQQEGRAAQAEGSSIGWVAHGPTRAHAFTSWTLSQALFLRAMISLKPVRNPTQWKPMSLTIRTPPAVVRTGDLGWVGVCSECSITEHAEVERSALSSPGGAEMLYHLVLQQGLGLHGQQKRLKNSVISGFWICTQWDYWLIHLEAWPIPDCRTFFKSSFLLHTDGQWAHEKMLYITNY